ncbi:MAG: 1-acyl-sn-glycerol-3-phosphate acyltransferase [Bacteroidales bacterium]|jgi:1-acyl-sn-glycerol-3-phosphate acyltransferase|nr:1-acyl-sn-glycerol-3-phosphate acyltransferase [Bacteroidales bacterium]
MIDFERVDKPNFKYSVLHPYINFFHEYIFYSKYYVLNRERIPRKKPVVVISNHQNGLSDALGILFAFRKDGRYPVFIARSDIFKKDFVAKLLRLLRIMPAYRARDASSGSGSVRENSAIFSKSARILSDNGVVCLFPEAGHEDCHHLGSFKKGFARIAFSAAEEMNFEKPVYILPCSNHYSHYFGFQHKLIITVGEPFSFEELYDLYREHPDRARKVLTEWAHERIQGLMLNIKDKALYEEYDILRTLYARNVVKREGQKAWYYPNILKAEQKIVASVDRLRDDNPEDFNALMLKAREYSVTLDKLHVYDWVLAEKISFGTVVFRTLLALLLIPLLIYGCITNFIPYNASTLITRKIKDPMLHNSFHFGISCLISYPIWFIATFITVWHITGVWWIALCYLGSVPVSLVVYIRGKIMVKKQLMRFTRFGFWWRGDFLYHKAKSIRAQIVAILDRIVK